MGYAQQVKEDAAAVAAHIRKHGWVQGRYETAEGACCAVGGIVRVTGGGLRDDDLRHAFRTTADCHTITGYNDARGRTKEEVIAVFDRIANS